MMPIPTNEDGKAWLWGGGGGGGGVGGVKKGSCCCGCGGRGLDGCGHGDG